MNKTKIRELYRELVETVDAPEMGLYYDFNRELIYKEDENKFYVVCGEHNPCAETTTETLEHVLQVIEEANLHPLSSLTEEERQKGKELLNRLREELTR